MKQSARSLPSPSTLWLRSAREIGAPQWIIDRIADEQMYNASIHRNLHAVRKDGANAPEEARRIIEAGDLEKELRPAAFWRSNAACSSACVMSA